METLLFANHVFHAGVNLTTRLGSKWLNKVIPGDNVLISNLDGSEVSQATVVSVLIQTFKDIPLSLLKFEHDPSCRTHEGLLKEMNRVYPECTNDSTVTIILFVPNNDSY